MAQTQTETPTEFVNLAAAVAIYDQHTYTMPGFTHDYLRLLFERGVLAGRTVNGVNEVDYDALIALTQLDLEANLRRVREGDRS